MKKFLLFLLILFLLFVGYILYDEKNTDKIPILDIEEQIIEIDEIYVYGTHLNMHGNIIDGENLQLVLYNGEFIYININSTLDGFNFSDLYNDGIYLDDIPRGEYFLFLSSKETIDEEEKYKYYSLKNVSSYKETTYYALSDTNNKIIISNEDSYPTMKINVLENTDKDIYDIVLDPGHGGLDGGADRYGYKESDFTLDIAVKVKKKLEENGLKIKLTHEEGQLSKNEKLKEYGVHGRAVIPYEVKAKYLFSFHMNSNVSSSVNGLEIYTSKNINYDFAKLLGKNIRDKTGISYSENQINKTFDGIYAKSFSEQEIAKSKKEYEDKGRNPYDITLRSNYYYIIRETGGIITGAYVDDRNEDIIGNPYVNSNVGTEAYLLELGYISNQNDLNNMVNNMDKYVDAIVESIMTLYKSSQ